MSYQRYLISRISSNRRNRIYQPNKNFVEKAIVCIPGNKSPPIGSVEDVDSRVSICFMIPAPSRKTIPCSTIPRSESSSKQFN